MSPTRLFSLTLLMAGLPAWAQAPAGDARLAVVKAEPAAAAPVAPGAVAPRAPAPGDVGFTPTWETQKHARTYLLGIPAPRGQIVDRNGEPLAQTRVSFNLAVVFPTPLTFSEEQVISFVQQQVQTARRIVGRTITV